MKIKVILIDDEYLARERIAKLLNSVPEIEIIDECSNGKEAIASIQRNNPTCIFLDIKMKDMNGFEVLNAVPRNQLPYVIFVSAFDKFAIKAFDYLAIDYLLKPFKDERFYKAIKILIAKVQNDKTNENFTKLNDLLQYVEKNKSSALQDFIPIKLSNKVYFLKNKNIQYIKASGYYAEIFTDKKKHVLRKSLTNLEEKLDDSFIRIHRSTIINLHFVKQVIYSNFGEVDVKMQDDVIFRVSKGYKKEFQTIIKMI